VCCIVAGEVYEGRDVTVPCITTIGLGGLLIW